MTTTLERTDEKLAEVVRHDLTDAAALRGTRIFVAVDRGAATLYGWVERIAQAELAEKLALTVPGIVAVAQELFVGGLAGMADTDIARQAAHALRHTARVGNVRATVRNEVMTLSGDVDWQYEREAACRAVKDIGNVQIVVNAITVSSDRLIADLEGNVAAALSGYVAARDIVIGISVDGRGVITLDGSLPSAKARLSAEDLCWAVPGVTGVRNHLVISRSAA
jgi:osmotically-inducible protein OsmY